jgi:hypothetical protein
MAIVALVSGKGSAGVTTSALTLGLGGTPRGYVSGADEPERSRLSG